MPKAIDRCVLPVPGGPKQDDVLFAGEEVELAEVLDDGLLDRALEGEVELLQRLVRGKTRGLDALAPSRGLAGRGLGREQRLGEAFVAPFLAAGAFGELGQRSRGGGCLQRAEQVRELAVGLGGHAGISAS